MGIWFFHQLEDEAISECSLVPELLLKPDKFVTFKTDYNLEESWATNCFLETFNFIEKTNGEIISITGVKKMASMILWLLHRS